VQLDVDFAGLDNNITSLTNFVKNVIRSDGALYNGIVTFDSLSPSLQTAGLTPALPWATGTAYVLGANAVQNSALYRSLVAHTSGVFATDLAAGKWLFIVALPVGTNGVGYGGTSATSLLIANSVTKTFATQAGLAYQVGSYVRASSAANGANYMEGLVSAYAGTSLSIAVTAIGGAGTFADWAFAIAGSPGVGVSTFNGLNGAVASRPAGIVNGKIAEQHGGGAAAFFLKTLAGADPSVGDPVFITFPDGTTASVTAAVSLTISAGSTLGATNAIPFRVWHELINDAGTIRFGTRNCSNASGVYGFPANGITSSTAEGGVGGATSAGVTYTGTAVSAKQSLILGYSEYDTGLVTAGSWAVSPSRNVVFAPGMPKPGDVIQSKQGSSVGQTSNATTSYVDTGLTATIMPSSAINPIYTSWSGDVQISAGSVQVSVALRRGGTVVGYPRQALLVTSGDIINLGENWMDAPGSAGSIVYTVALKINSGTATAYFTNPSGGAVLQLAEIMG
jgi:hypothetical protein